jgi:ADP-heptose:LPS heptosyltransferase
MADRIAVLRANALGDLMFAMPALEALRAAHPQAEISLLGSDWHAALLRNRPAPVDRVIPVPPSPGVRVDAPPAPPAELERFFAAMAGERFDLALQLHGGGRYSNPFVRRLGARLTVGLRTPDAEPLDRSVPYVYFQPEIMRYLEVVALAGARPVTVEPRIVVTPADITAADAQASPRPPYAVIHPGATDPRRRWPADRFAAAADRLADEGLSVLVTGTSGEQELVDSVLRHMQRPGRAVCGTLDLPGLVGLLAGAEIVISNDTGPVHLSAAVGTPSVGVYWIGNLVNGVPPFRALHRPVPSFRTSCPLCGADCTRGDCGHRESFVAEVPVETVLGEALSLRR